VGTLIQHVYVDFGIWALFEAFTENCWRMPGRIYIIPVSCYRWTTERELAFSRMIFD
jgi:hypothetical protein